MSYPKVKSVQAVDDHTLLIEFDNQQMKRYDVQPLFSSEMFRPLMNPALFRSVKVDQGGYAVIWNSDIDISEHELWSRGQAV